MNNKETDFQRGIRLLVTIVLYLLLAVAFLSPFMRERQQLRENREQRSEEFAIIGANLGCLFLLGFIIIIFALMGYILKKTKQDKRFVNSLFVLGMLFSFVFVKTFLEELKFTNSQFFLLKPLTMFITPTAVPLSIFVVLVITIIFLFSKNGIKIIFQKTNP